MINIYSKSGEQVTLFTLAARWKNLRSCARCQAIGEKMKTLSMGSTLTRSLNLRKVLLVCGILSGLEYVTATILGALSFAGYSSSAQTISELIAIDAPSRPLVALLFGVYAVLVYAFGVGVWQAAGQKRVLRVAAVLMVAKEVLGLVVTLFFPIHLRGQAATLSDSLHGMLTAVGVFACMFPAMGFAAAAFGKRFRLYSIATMLVFLACGVLTFLQAPLIGANLPTPWMGVWERVNAFGYMLWMGVLALQLLRQGGNRTKLTSYE
jgi:hypothetical protein